MGDSNLTGKEIIIENVTYGAQLMKKDRLLRYRGHTEMLDHGPLCIISYIIILNAAKKIQLESP